MSVLDCVSKDMPALLRSQRLQDIASSVGFDFENLSQVLEKVKEEMDELLEAIQKGTKEEIKHELGDLLTAIVELSRFLNMNAEEVLQRANDRFERRFKYLEERAKKMGKSLKDMSLSEMEKIWLEAKRFDYIQS
ncbi:MAG: MazG nucleotide pyrophosphohydrolase domain-containing protein [Aquificaceae bacterium]